MGVFLQGNAAGVRGPIRECGRPACGSETHQLPHSCQEQLLPRCCERLKAGRGGAGGEGGNGKHRSGVQETGGARGSSPGPPLCGLLAPPGGSSRRQVLVPSKHQESSPNALSLQGEGWDPRPVFRDLMPPPTPANCMQKCCV